MDDNLRLSDLTGISDSQESSSSFWPVNIALATLGASIIAVAFYFLDASDSRITRNPWTYAVATPVALLVLSAVLSSFVSRVVEKSMQLAFLLSVLIHILLLAYAVNIVIFSRMWPDILQSLSQEKHQLQREALQAKQYVRFSSSSKSGRKPDYLRHVPTLHQPSEVKEAESQAIQLTRSEQANLASPTPELKPSDTAHLAERAQAQSSTQAYAQTLASLARSDIQSPDTPSREIPVQNPSTPDTAQPAPLQPSKSSVSRSESSSQAKPAAPSRLTPSPNRSSSQPSLTRRESTTARNPILSQSAQQPTRALQAQAANSMQAVPIPQTTRANPSAQSLSASSARLQRQRASQPASSSAIALSAPSPSPSANAQMNTRIERARASDLPDISGGQQSVSIPRTAAGGQPSQSSQFSMPIQGPQLLADASSESRLAPIETDRRNNGLRRSTQGSSGPARPSSPTFSGTPSAGNTGSGTNTGLRAPSNGKASLQDIADLEGASRDIQRAALGASGNTGGSNAVVANSAQGGPEQSQEREQALAANNSADTRRSTQGSSTGATASQPTAGPQGNQQAIAAQLPSRDMRSGEFRSSDSLASSDASAPGLGRSSNAPTENLDSSVSLDGLDAPNNEASSPALAASDSRLPTNRRSSDVTTASSALQIEAPDGIAGLELTPNQTGPLLARRSDRESRDPIPQLEPQRFSRQRIGGPLAGGQQFAVPKPAFQQRIDRLKDRTPRDESSIHPQTELAIERGLAFLDRTQREDGSWRLQDYDTKLLMRSDTAATGLALLAFQGAGYTHQQFKYADTVRRGTEFLVKNQKGDGDLYIRQNPASDQNAWLYSHGIAALALCEAYGMTQDPKLRDAAQKSIDFMATSQDPQKGGWRYRPGFGADTSVSGWFLMALKSGQLAGLDVPQGTMQGIEGYLGASQVSDDQAHLYRYNPYALDNAQQGHGLKPTAVMTSVGLLMRLYTGWDRQLPAMQAGADVLLRYAPEHGTVEKSRRDTYYWYYATQVMFHMRGKHWKEWHDKLYPLLIDHQVTSGDLAGSWNPTTPTPDLWARYGGRLYVTTMNLLSLEVSYRHLPLYEAAAK